MASSMLLRTFTPLALFVAPVAGNTFLAAHELAALVDDSDLLKDLSSVFSGGSAANLESSAGALEESLRPTFRALPQSSGGRVDATAARYLLHRLFVDRHGWVINGLHPRGDAWNVSSPLPLLRSVGEGLEKKVNASTSTSAFTLNQVAVLGAVLESLVHKESVERLRSAYRIAGLSTTDSTASEEQVMEAMTIFMHAYVLGLNHSTQTRAAHDRMFKMISSSYPNWDVYMQWVQDLRLEVLSRGVDSPTSFGTTLLVLELMSERYGRWQNQECVDLKGSLMELEEKSSGRVRLSTFYQSFLDGKNWQFREAKKYLQQLGALDENDVSRPSIIIPNYINSPSNCLHSSTLYSVCCIDECEALMGQIEQKVAAPQATPERIVDIVQELKSSTITAPRDLPLTLLGRLDEIAKHHKGSVPLHGRLFAQWLHHAYPRECQYPHVSGTTSPATAEEYMQRSGESGVADRHTLLRHVEEARVLQAQTGAARDDGELPWSAEEEFYVSHSPLHSTQASTLRTALRGLAVAAVACSTAWVVVQAAFVADPKGMKESDAKYAV